MKVYLDTNGWTRLSEWVEVNGIAILRSKEYLFSSCVLDEIALASNTRARSIANTAWRLSNRNKLYDHLEMTVVEITAFQNGMPITTIYDESDKAFFNVWTALRKKGLSIDFLREVRSMQSGTKGDFQSHLKQIRSYIKKLPESMNVDQWAEEYSRMVADGDLHEYLINILRSWKLLSLVPREEEIRNISLEMLPCTSCWLQYFVGLSFLSTFGTGRISRPDSGDQVDFRHVCYAGLSDIYVTGDKRMTELLTDFVTAEKAEILDVDEYIQRCKNN